MKTTGQLLKARREALKISLAEVSISTKITTRMLQAIEEGNMDKLPARPFLRGFVKSYAAYLKMDTDLVLKSFNEDMAALEPAPVLPPEAGAEPEAAAAPMPKIEVPEPKHATTGNLIPEGMSNLKKAGLAAGLVALMALILVVYQQVQKYEKESQVDTPPPTLSKIEQPKEEAPKKEEKTETPPAEDKASAETKTEAPPAVEVKPPEPKPEETTEVKAVETPKPVAEVTPPVAPPAAPPAPKPAEETKPAAPVAATQEIIIEALDKVDITFRVNNGQQRKVSLGPDQVHTIKAVGAVAIEMSDGGAVNIIHNGRDLGVPGDLGRPKKIQLP
jgi:cytoskeleton protein RodZ